MQTVSARHANSVFMQGCRASMLFRFDLSSRKPPVARLRWQTSFSPQHDSLIVVLVLVLHIREQFHIENADCSGSRESDYPQLNTQKNHAFSEV